MTTGNIDNAFRKFERSLRKVGVNVSSFDSLSLRTGDPFILMKVLRALVFETTPQVSRQLLDRGCIMTCTDKKVLNGVFDQLREAAKYSSPLTVDQFLSKQMFAEHKLLFLVAVSEYVDSFQKKPKSPATPGSDIFRNKLHVDHPEGTPKAFFSSRGGASPSPRLDVTTPRSPKIDISNMQNLSTPNVDPSSRQNNTQLATDFATKASLSDKFKATESMPSTPSAISLTEIKALVSTMLTDMESKIMRSVDTRLEKLTRELDAKFILADTRLKSLEAAVAATSASSATATLKSQSSISAIPVNSAGAAPISAVHPPAAPSVIPSAAASPDPPAGSVNSLAERLVKIIKIKSYNILQQNSFTI
jgi:hypothetical protein